MKLSMSKNKITTGIAVLVVGAVLTSTVVLAAGGGMGGGARGGGVGNLGEVTLSESVITVKLQNPETGTLSRETEFIGKIEPAESVSIYPETSGKVTAVYFEAGDTVQAGDLLFTLDDSDAQLSYQVKQASYDKTTVSIDTTLGSGYDSKLLSAKNKLESAQQNLSNARLKLKDNNDGYDDLLITAEKAEDRTYEALQKAELALSEYTGSTNDAEYTALYKAVSEASTAYSLAHSAVNDLEDETDDGTRDLRNSYKNAQADYTSALADYNLLSGASLADTQAAADVDLKAAELSLAQSASELDKYQVRAPISGVIESRSANVYDMVSANTAVFTIANKDSMMVNFNASSDAAVALSAGDTVTLTKGETSYTALIASVNARADEATGLFPVKAQLQDASGALLSGVSVKVSATTQKAENALLIPLDVVYYDDGQAYVFAYADGKAVRADIKTGMSDSANIVATAGLTADSRIITTWHPDLKDGATVLLAEEAQQTEPVETASVPVETQEG